VIWIVHCLWIRGYLVMRLRCRQGRTVAVSVSLAYTCHTKGKAHSRRWDPSVDTISTSARFLLRDSSEHWFLVNLGGPEDLTSVESG